MLEELEEFFRKFYEEDLLEAVREDKDFVLIDFRKLDKYAGHELTEELLENPKEFFDAAEDAVGEIDLGVDKEVDLNVRVENIPDDEKTRIKDLRSKHLGKFVKVEGTVNRASEVKPELEVAVFECPDCGEKMEVPQLKKRMSYPSRCDCGRKRGFNQVGRELSDARWIHVEDLFEKVSGEKPGEVSVYLKDGLTTPRMQRRTDPGTRLEITGRVREMPKRIQGKKTRQLDIFLEANWLSPKETTFEDMEVTEEEEDKIQELAGDDKIYNKLIKSLAPSMYGLDEEKEAIILQLFGGVPHRLPDGTKIRGDIHILFVGDPSSGKTQLLKLAADMLPRGKYASGKGTSAAGLTATVVRDEEFMGGWVLEAGALVLANQGVLCIDEFDKMSKEDQVNLHEAMSTQSYHPDFKLLVPDGSSRKIGELVDGLMDEYDDRIVEGEDCEMLEVPEDEDLELVSTDFSSIYPRKPSRVSRHEAPEQFYVLRIGSGREVKVTPEHPVWTIKDGEITTLRADEVKEGSWIPVPLSLPIEGEEQELDEVGGFHPNSKEIEIPVHNSPELCSLIGYIISDCGYEMNRGKKNGLNFTNSDPCLLRDFRSLMDELFGLEPYERERDDGGSSRTTLRYVSSRLRDFLNGLGGGLLVKHDKKRIPEKIMKCRRDDIRNLLQRAFAGDGGIVDKDRGLEVVYTTSSEELARQISDLLLRFSVPSKIRKCKAESGKGIYRVVVSGQDSIKKFAEEIGFLREEENERLLDYLDEDKSLRKNLFETVPEVGGLVTSILEDLNMSREKVVGWSLEEYENNKISFTRPTLKRIVPDLEERYIELLNTVSSIPKEGVELREIRLDFGVEVKDIAEEMGVSPGTIYYREDNSTKLNEYTEVLQEKLKERLDVKTRIEFLKHIVEGEIGWVQVDEVEKVPNDVDMVYDVTVPGRTFISNGMVLHNTVSISKATIQATLPAETSIIGGANPKFSRFDPYRPIAEQIDIPDTILSRFDLKFVLRDVPDKQRDEEIVDHIIGSRIEGEEAEPLIDIDFLRKYISYARRNSRPEITKKSASVLKNFYVDMRSKYIDAESDTVPITLRQYEALQRLAEASAKVRLAETVEKQDAQRAIRLMKHSIKQLGMDPETHEIDIDRAEGGTPASERSKMSKVMDVLDDLEEDLGKNIPEEDLLSAMEEQGLSKPEKLIQEMKNKGMIFEPRPGHVQKV